MRVEENKNDFVFENKGVGVNKRVLIIICVFVLLNESDLGEDMSEQFGE
jgi:hypothetical protein